jgi:ATP dependent DNA ligase domain
VAFDLLELDGSDLRSKPLCERKTRLAKVIAKVRDGIEFNEHIEGDGTEIFSAACKLGHEGIVAKRKDLPYESGRSKRWSAIGTMVSVLDRNQGTLGRRSSARHSRSGRIALWWGRPALGPREAVRASYVRLIACLSPRRTHDTCAEGRG